MFATRVLRAGTVDSAIRTIQMNRYKARKEWPPDVSKLDTKHQFRLERKFRRRSKMKFERPGWIKGVKLVQWGLCFGMCKNTRSSLSTVKYVDRFLFTKVLLRIVS